MEHLHDDRGRTGGAHAREVSVHLPRDAAGSACEARVAGRAVVDAGFVVTAPDGLDVGAELRAQGGGRGQVHPLSMAILVTLVNIPDQWLSSPSKITSATATA